MSKAEVRIDAFETRKKNGRYCCPFCDPGCESRGSLAFYSFENDNMQKVVYGKCFKCSETGHVSKFLKEMGIAEEHYKDVVIKNVSSSNGKIDKDEINLVYASSFPVIESAEYMRKLQNWRGWSFDTIKKFEIRFLSQTEIWKFPDKYKSWRAGGYISESGAKHFSEGWFLFPFFNKDHRIIYIKARNYVTDAANKDYKRFKNTKGVMPFPYGMWLLRDYQQDAIDNFEKMQTQHEAEINELFEKLNDSIPPISDLQEYLDIKALIRERKKTFLSKLNEKQHHGAEIFICEGETDTLSAHSSGIFAVGIPGANAFRQSWCKYFQNLNVCLAFDVDKPDKHGRLAGQDAINGRYSKDKDGNVRTDQNGKAIWLPGIIEILTPFVKTLRRFKLPAGFNDYSEMFQSKQLERV